MGTFMNISCVVSGSREDDFSSVTFALGTMPMSIICSLSWIHSIQLHTTASVNINGTVSKVMIVLQTMLLNVMHWNFSNLISLVKTGLRKFLTHYVSRPCMPG